MSSESVERGSIPPLSPIKFAGYESLRCYENCYGILKNISRRSNFEPEKARVLYISSFAGYGAHAVIEYDGWIIDPNDSEETGIIPQVSAADYFKSKNSKKNSRVKVIPATDYLKGFPKFGSLYYLLGLSKVFLPQKGDPVHAAAVAAYPTTLLEDYVKLLPEAKNAYVIPSKFPPAPERPITDILQKLIQFSSKNSAERTPKDGKFWYKYKNDERFSSQLLGHEEPEARSVDLSLRDEPEVADDELPTFRGARSRAAKILLLRRGDTVTFGKKKSYVLGDFLGAGNATHIYALRDFPGYAIRIPFFSAWNPPEAEIRSVDDVEDADDAQDLSSNERVIHLVDRFIKRYQRTPKELRIDITEVAKDRSYMIVSQVNPEETAMDFMLRILKEKGLKPLSTRGGPEYLPLNFSKLLKGKDLARYNDLMRKFWPDYMLPRALFSSRAGPERCIYLYPARQIVWDLNSDKWVLVDFE